MQVSGRSLLLSLVVASALISQSAHAISVTAIGSFNDQSASSVYFYNRIYNQDDATSPARRLPPNLNTATDSVAYFGWGIDVQDSLASKKIIQSHFWFNGVGSVGGGPAASTPFGSAFSLGRFTYTNEQTILSGGLVEVDFQLGINVGGQSLLPVEYRLEINNTTNNTPGAFDIARLIRTPSNMAFFIDGSEYMLTFNGFSRDGGSTFESVAYLNEGMQTSAEIFATITPIPVPAAVWLLGSGLLALVGFVRSKK